MIQKQQFKALFQNETPLLDVRAPCEFAQGAFPYATNIALLSDEERHQVGLCYKQKGQDKAIELGHQIVSGGNKENKIKAWKEFCIANPQAFLYCFRGGMRSNLVQQWLKEEGVEIPLISGGYKQLRQYLLSVIDRPRKLIRLSGQTGVGKTELLITLDNAIDLEGLANHRGSAFGKHVSVQPTQISFENELAIELLKSDLHVPLIVEDESRYIGAINLPLPFIENMQSTPMVILTCPQSERVNRIYRDYIVLLKQEYQQFYFDEGKNKFDSSLKLALQGIQKRLGGLRYSALSVIMNEALKTESENLHKQWISQLLEHYYDPMYNYQIDKKKELTVFTGDAKEVEAYFNTLESFE
jgi:tRNA 2-selenouridine synthase